MFQSSTCRLNGPQVVRLTAFARFLPAPDLAKDWLLKGAKAEFSYKHFVIVDGLKASVNANLCSGYLFYLLSLAYRDLMDSVLRSLSTVVVSRLLYFMSGSVSLCWQLRFCTIIM